MMVSSSLTLEHYLNLAAMHMRLFTLED